MNKDLVKEITRETVTYLAELIEKSQKSLDELYPDGNGTVSLDEYVKTLTTYNNQISAINDYTDPRRKELVKEKNSYKHLLETHGDDEEQFLISKIRLSKEEIVELMGLVSEAMAKTDIINPKDGRYSFGESAFITEALRKLENNPEMSSENENSLQKWLLFFRSSDTAGFDDRLRGNIILSPGEFKIEKSDKDEFDRLDYTTVYRADLDIDDIER